MAEAIHPVRRTSSSDERLPLGGARFFRVATRAAPRYATAFLLGEIRQVDLQLGCDVQRDDAVEPAHASETSRRFIGAITPTVIHLFHLFRLVY
jgi:hypothetical protein